MHVPHSRKDLLEEPLLLLLLWPWHTRLILTVHGLVDRARLQPAAAVQSGGDGSIRRAHKAPTVSHAGRRGGPDLCDKGFLCSNQTPTCRPFLAGSHQQFDQPGLHRQCHASLGILFLLHLKVTAGGAGRQPHSGHVLSSSVTPESGIPAVRSSAV